MDRAQTQEPAAAGGLLPEIVTDVPGPRSRELAKRLAGVESRNVTRLAPEAPIFWERAFGSNVVDVDGNRYLDLGGAFGVANVGHAHPRVVAAVREQAGALLHGMGDVHPARVKVSLLEALVACAGVTLQAVATAFGVKLTKSRVTAEGDLDFRGTLGVAKDAPVGFRDIRLSFDIDGDAPAETLDKIVDLTERYCVVLQTIENRPNITTGRAP